MRKLCTAAIAISLFASSVALAETSLAPGRPAGVKPAQMGTKEVLIFGGLAVVGVTIAAVSGFGGGQLTQDLRGTANVTSTTANP
ncbi:hypothetical protein AYO42_05475 [Rhizomicrobium sp. SCGC AG-212-E05]|nr:hypothetical protein AYO42_05475 [Rhizomicrobium sp. SCGC AG-212-E05]